MLHVKTDEIYGKNPVTNVADYRTHLVSIDSRFRHNLLEPSTDFHYRFAHTYKNMVKARVASAEIPPVWYNFSKAKRNTMFRLEVMDYTGQPHHLQVTIADGEYTTADQLLGAIQEQLNGLRDTYGVFFRIYMDPITRRVTITHDGSAPPPCPKGPTHCPVAFGITWMMMGLEERPFDFGLGANLGFTRHFYTVDEPFRITSESVMDLEGDSYFLLAVDDFYTVEHKTTDNYVQCLAKVLLRKSHPTNAVENSGCTVLSNEIVFPKPMDLSQVRIQLLDRYGVPLDLHAANFSLSLELTEVTNVQLYDNYRTYLWTEAEPRCARSTTGSGVPIAPPGRNFN
jgi:hypothetical protein